MYHSVVCIFLLLFLQLAFAQSDPNLDYDPPEPYVTHPVNYTGDFETLHNELERPLNGTVREYYIAAEDVIWDYAQHAGNVAENQAVHFWIASGSTSIGSRYYKAIYREYTDATYSTATPRPQWQGLLGPVLRAEVGDTIKVHFYNKASHKFSIHPHGVFYEFEMEGAVYKDATEFSSVAPGGNYTYTWQVYPRAGPGPNDGDSIVWGYHSHVSENDIYAGLFGPIVIYKPGMMDQEHISREIITAILGFNENVSPYLPQTLAELAPQIDFGAVKSNRSAHTLFRRANIKQSVNGLITSRPNDLVLQTDTIYQWHVLGWGSVKDLHTITWQQGEVTLYDQPVRQVRLMPASFRTLQIKVDEPGSWQFGYLYGESAIEGMIMWYNVIDRYQQEK